MSDGKLNSGLCIFPDCNQFLIHPWNNWQTCTEHTAEIEGRIAVIKRRGTKNKNRGKFVMSGDILDVPDAM